jgi:hypothetical protein
MALNYKLFFKYILFHNSQIFIKYLHRNDKNLVVFIPSNNFYYLALHLKLSSLFYSTQLVDIFAYEVPTNINFKQTADKISFTADSIIFYNFHSILFQQRFFIISTGHFINNKNKRATLRSYIGSVAEIFPNAN